MRRQWTTFEIAFLFLGVGATLLAGVFIMDLIEKRTSQKPVHVSPFAAYPFNAKLFKQKKNELISRAYIEQEMSETDPRVIKAKSLYLDKQDIGQIPEMFFNKWIPDPTRFIGVEEFLVKTESNGTIVEEFFYCNTPIIQMSEDNHHAMIFASEAENILYDLSMDGCGYRSDTGCHGSEITLRHGDLFINEFLVGDNFHLQVLRVFYIPAFELIKLIE